MSQRETKQFETPGGHKVILKTYLTAREVIPVTDATELKSSEKTQKLIEIGVISLDASTDNVVDRVLDLPISDYTAIVKELTGLFSDLTATK